MFVFSRRVLVSRASLLHQVMALAAWRRGWRRGREVDMTDLLWGFGWFGRVTSSVVADIPIMLKRLGINLNYGKATPEYAGVPSNGQMTAKAPKLHASADDWFPYHVIAMPIRWET